MFRSSALIALGLLIGCDTPAPPAPAPVPEPQGADAPHSLPSQELRQELAKTRALVEELQHHVEALHHRSVAEHEALGARLSAMESAPLAEQPWVQAHFATTDRVDGLAMEVESSSQAVDSALGGLEAQDARVNTLAEDLTEARLRSEEALLEVEQLEALVDAVEVELAALGPAGELLEVLRLDERGDVHIEGANLILSNGTGRLDELNGRGNLILGVPDPAAEHPGSHNLVLGEGHRWESYGALISGVSNHVSAPHATLLSSWGSAVEAELGSCLSADDTLVQGVSGLGLGGFSNRIRGDNAFVLGGSSSEASGGFSGAVNSASAEVSAYQATLLAAHHQGLHETWATSGAD